MRLFILLTMTFCLSAQLTAQNHHNVMEDAIPICAHQFTLDQFYEANVHSDVKLNSSCIGHFKEVSSVWLTFTVEASEEDLTFSITPKNFMDDIDFVLFENGRESVNAIRCISSGPDLSRSLSSKANCLGSTGLTVSSSDVSESYGCKAIFDGYGKSVPVTGKKQYFLLVTNFRSSNGFSLSIDKDIELYNSCNPKSYIAKYALYPNPTSEYININMSVQPRKYTDYTFEIIDALGMIRDNIKAEDAFIGGRIHPQIDISHLSPGSYLLRIWNEKNGELNVRPFIKH